MTQDSETSGPETSETAEPLTALAIAEQLAERAGRPLGDTVSASELAAVGIPFAGGCGGCGESLAAYNAFPDRRNGHWACRACLTDGYHSIEQWDGDHPPSQYSAAEGEESAATCEARQLLGATLVRLLTGGPSGERASDLAASLTSAEQYPATLAALRSAIELGDGFKLGPVTVTYEMVKRVFIHAFAGGSNYWIRSWEAKGEPTGGSDVWNYATEPGCYAEFKGYDFEDDDEPARVDRAAVERGFALMAETRPKHFADLVTGEDDAATADIALQLMAFGKVVYA